MAIHLTRIDELALVTLDRLEVLNALSFDLLRDLGAGRVLDGEGEFTVLKQADAGRALAGMGGLPIGLAHGVKL